MAYNLPLSCCLFRSLFHPPLLTSYDHFSLGLQQTIFLQILFSVISTWSVNSWLHFIIFSSIGAIPSSVLISPFINSSSLVNHLLTLEIYFPLLLFQTNLQRSLPMFRYHEVIFVIFEYYFNCLPFFVFPLVFQRFSHIYFVISTPC